MKKKKVLLQPDCDITVQQPIAEQLTHLQEATCHVIPEHWQTGSALPVHVYSVDCHDNGLQLAIVRHQDADPAVTKANRVV